MVKLGQQPQAQFNSNSQAKPTRTQRLLAQEQQQKEQAKLDTLRAQAQQVQETQFKDKVVTENYAMQVPKDFLDRKGNPTKEWNNFSSATKSAILRKTPKQKIVTITGTREVVIPFTLDQGENSYEKIYAGLSPDIQQFFVPPETLKQERSQRIKENTAQLDTRISNANQRLAELDQIYEAKKQKLQDQWTSKSSESRKDPRNREMYEKNLKALEDRYDKDREEQLGLIEGLQRGRNEYSNQNDIDFNSIISYADNLSNYYAKRKEVYQQERDKQRLKALTEPKPVQNQEPVVQNNTQPTDQDSSVKMAREFESQVESLPVTDQSTSQAPAPKKSFIRKAMDTIGDVLSGIFLKSTVGLGTRGFISGEPTGMTGEQLATERQKAIDKITIFGLTKDELKGNKTVEKKGLSQFFGFNLGFPSIISIEPTQLAGIKLSKDVRESGENVIAQRELDVKTIHEGTDQLRSTDDEVKVLNQQLQENKISPEVAKQQFSDIQQRRLSVFKDLASKGIKSNIETDEQGNQSITFTSKSIDTDTAPASVKLLRQTNSAGKAKLIAGGLATEALEYGTIGVATGGSGTSAKIGVLISKLPKVAKTGTLFALGSAVVANIGYSGYKGMKQGEEAGLGKGGGFLLGASIPATQTVAFAGGAYLGNKFYTQQVVDKFKQGGYTRPDTQEVNIEGRKVKAPVQMRSGETTEAPGQTTTKVNQVDKLKTKIPGTDIEIDTNGVLRGRFSGNNGFSQGVTESEVKGSDAGAFQDQKFYSRSVYIDSKGKTAIVTFTNTGKGVQIDQFRTGVKINDYRLLGESEGGTKTVFLDFNRYVEKVGEPIVVKGASMSDDSIGNILKTKIDANRIFTSFAGEDDIYTLGRTQQIVTISPKTPQTTTYDVGEDVMNIISENVKVQTFKSIGSSRITRTDALKGLIDAFAQKDETGVFAEGLWANKGGKLAFPSFAKPEAIRMPSSAKLPANTLMQDQFTAISPLASEIEGTVKNAINLNSLLGSFVIAGTANASGLTWKERSVLSERIKNLEFQNVKIDQNQTPIEEQQQSQQQAQRQMQRLNQQLEQTPFQVPMTNPTPPTPITTMPNNPQVKIPDFDLEFLENVRKKARARKSKKDIAYVQDFTSKIIDANPVEVSESQALKLAQKVQTGFEVRMPIIVKKNADQKRLKKLLAQ